MAGHSHAANIKHKKDRKDSLRSQAFLKLRRKLEQIIEKDGYISEKATKEARENGFPKEKLTDILKKIKSGKSQEVFSRNLFYNDEFELALYFEGNQELEDIKNIEEVLQVKKISLSLLDLYFKKFYEVSIDLNDDNLNFEELIITSFPEDIWEKISVNVEERRILIRADENIEETKDKLFNNLSNKLEIKKEQFVLKPLLISKYKISDDHCPDEDFNNYYKKIKDFFGEEKFYTNII